MRHWIPLSLALFSVCAGADDTPRKFVRWSPLAEEEIAREKARLPSTLTEVLGDKYFRDPTRNHRFRVPSCRARENSPPVRTAS